MTSVALWLFLGYLTLGSRVSIGRADGFAGLPVFELLFVVAAILAWLKAGRPRPALRGGWVVTVGPMFFLLLFLPAAGVLLGAYGVTSLYSWMVVLVPLAALALTVTARSRVLPFCHAAIVVHGTYAAGQLMHRLGLLPAAVGGPMRAWDIESQRSLNEAYVIVGRSTGLFINANIFALWGLTALVFAFYYLKGAQRVSGVTLAIIGVLASQSRTGLVCLAVLFVFWAVRALRDSGTLSRYLLPTVVFLLPSLLLSYVLGVWNRLIEGGLANRWSSLFAILGEGVEVDDNLMGRLDSWQLALAYSPTDPRFSFGTLGPPQVQFGNSIDNQFVAFYLQGGVLLLGAFVLALLSPVMLARRGVPQVVPLAVGCFVVALGSLSMTAVFAAQAICLVWVVAGLTVLGAQTPSVGPRPDASGHQDAAGARADDTQPRGGPVA